MQHIKGAIRVFAILMALCCLYYLSFTYATQSYEKKADQYANNYIAQKSVQEKAEKAPGGKEEYLDSVKNARERFFLEDSMPNKKIWLGIHTYQECKEKELNLGLDLKGGMNVTMEVSVPEIIRALAGNPNTPEFNAVMNRAAEMAKTSNENFVTLFGKAFQEKMPNGNMSNLFRAQLKDKIAFSATNDQVLEVLRREADESVDRAKLVLEKRVNKFGVSQPNIQKLEASGRILVELPGVKDPRRVRKLLQGTANLEFWRTYENAEVLQDIIDADYKLQVKLGLTQDTTAKTADTLAAKDSAGKDTSGIAKAKKDSAGIARAGDSIRKDSGKTLTELAKASKDTAGLGGKPRKNPLLEILQPMYDQKNGPYPGPVVGSAQLKDTARINEYLNMPEIKELFPTDLRFAWAVKPQRGTNNQDYYQLVALRAERDGRAAMQGDVIVDASKQYNQMSGATPEISMDMNTEGATNWKRITGSNVGRAIAIVLDGYVYTFPTVQDEIAGGRSQITGNFTSREADDIVNVLKAGKLPAPARIVEEVIVGPTLGQEAISSGVLSFLVALVVVLLYMAIYYSKAGLVANIALLVNMFFIMGVLASLGAVLTLPGIAGIVLTIGLSVDANILIFERVREELRNGKGISLAIADGFKHAMSSILDSNITLLLLGIILYAFGTGPVQGFATTLIIGILSSLFCAIFISRLVFDWMLKRGKNISFSIPATENIMRNTKINFVGKRKLYYAISFAVIALGAVFYVKNGGFNLGVDFSGGRTYTVSFTKEIPTEQVHDALKVQFPGAALEVKTAGGPDRHKITTNYRIEEAGTSVDDEVATKLNEGLSGVAGAGNFKVESSTKVGPSIAQDVVTGSYLVLLVSCILMFVYILFRFRKWQFGLGAVVALFHDVLIVLSCYTIFDGIVPFALEIDQHFIAAILTVMGYTMTESVIVFDRIREYLAGEKKSDIYGQEKINLINYALNSTLSRTINTSLTIFFVLLVIFIFGGDTIRGFIFALLIGRIIGTYSSLCISTPIVVDFDRTAKSSKLATA